MSSMRVDFYLQSAENTSNTLLIACRLLEKAYQRGHRVFVFCNDQTEAQSLDELLWTFKDESFIPHNLQGEGPDLPPPIQIGFADEPARFNDILLNLADTIPSFYTGFNRVMQIVAADDAARERSREHYRFYRSKHCDLRTHNLD